MKSAVNAERKYSSREWLISSPSLALRHFMTNCLKSADYEVPSISRPSSSEALIDRNRLDLEATLEGLRREYKDLKERNDYIVATLSQACRQIHFRLDDLDIREAYLIRLRVIQIIIMCILGAFTGLTFGIVTTTFVVFELAFVGILFYYPMDRKVIEIDRTLLQSTLKRLEKATCLSHEHTYHLFAQGSESHVVPSVLGDHYQCLKTVASSESTFDPAHSTLNFAANLGLEIEQDLLSLSNSQRIDLRRLKEELAKVIPNHSSYFPDDFTILRFFVCANYSPPGALKRILTALRWIEIIGLDRLVPQARLKMIRRGFALRPQTFSGFDKFNRPVLIEQLGDFLSNEQAWRGLLLCEWQQVIGFRLSEILNFCRLASRQSQRFIYRCVHIVDMTGFSLCNFLRLLPFLEIVADVQNNFGLIFEIICVNANPWLQIVWNCVKRTVDIAAPHSVTFLEGNWQNLLIENLGPSCIPRIWGGESDVAIVSCPLQVDDRFDEMFPV